MNIFSNASQIAKRYRVRAQQLSQALRKGLRNAAIAVDAKQVENLSGSGPGGSYPVPVRTGNLRGGHFWDLRGDRLAIVGNTTEYAEAIHVDRPFLDRAAEDTPVFDIVADQVGSIW